MCLPKTTRILRVAPRRGFYPPCLLCLTGDNS